MLERLQRAAELRVDGKSWEEVSAALYYSVRTCQSWPVRYPDAWDALFVAALERRRTRLICLLAAIRAAKERKEQEVRHAAAEPKQPAPAPPVIRLQYRRSSEYEYPRAAGNRPPASKRRRGRFGRWIGRLLG